MGTFLPGILFALFWASASVATKFGLLSAPPFVLANTRFLLAGSLLLLFVLLSGKKEGKLPRGKEWTQLLFFSFLNTTVYLGAFVLAMKEVSAGIGSLSTATNPLFILLLSALWGKRRLRPFEVWGILLGLAGVAIASYPLIRTAHASLKGVLILLGGMLAVSAATVYLSRMKWSLTTAAVNGWQVLLGGLLLLPFTLLFSDFHSVKPDRYFWGGLLWLVVPVSIIALQLWFYLVRQDAVKASVWLFLCPIFGFFYSNLLLGEPLTGYTYSGTALVLGGLYLAQLDKWHPKGKWGKAPSPVKSS